MYEAEQDEVEREAEPVMGTTTHAHLGKIGAAQ
jgi:hypothetical protein